MDASTNSNGFRALDLEDGDRATFAAGTLSIELVRHGEEVSVSSAYDDADEVDHPPPEKPVRIVVGSAVSTLTLGPQPADRELFAKPEVPLVIQPWKSAELFVGVPLFVAVRAGTELIFERALQRLRLSYFGVDKTAGELMYAGRTSLKTSLDEVPIHAHRAVARVRVKNAAPTPYRIAQLRLPLPALALYRDDDGRLWTDDVSLVREDGDELRGGPESDFRHAPDGAERVCPPRHSLGAGWRANLLSWS